MPNYCDFQCLNALTDYLIETDIFEGDIEKTIDPLIRVLLSYFLMFEVFLLIVFQCPPLKPAGVAALMLSLITTRSASSREAPSTTGCEFILVARIHADPSPNLTTRMTPFGQVQPHGVNFSIARDGLNQCADDAAWPDVGTEGPGGTTEQVNSAPNTGLKPQGVAGAIHAAQITSPPV